MAVNSVARAEREMIGYLLSHLPPGFTKAQVFSPGGATNRTSGTPYLNCEMYPTRTVNIGPVGCYQRTTGQFVIGVFYPIGKGSQPALETAQALQQAFTNRWTDSVLFSTVQITPVNIGDTWYYVRVAVDYSHDGDTRDHNN